MQRRRITPAILLAGISLMATAAMGGETTSAPVSLGDKIDAIIGKAVEKKSFPGAVVIVGRGDKIQYEKAYGKYNYAPDAKPMTMDTLFDMASVSKVVGTASTAMGLYEEGRLKLDDPVAKYVNGFGQNGKDKITIRDLMTHVSGLPAYTDVNATKKSQQPGVSSADTLIMRIAGLKLSNEPRTTVTYSCLNMLTTARLNENILGTRQDDYITSKMWGPLGMKDTTYLPTKEQLERTAPSVQRPDGTDQVGSVHDPLANFHSPEDHCPGNAGVFSTAPDMAKFCEMIAALGSYHGKQIYKPETIKLMTSVQTPPDFTNVRGLGWDIFPKPPYATPANVVDGKRVVAHTGYTGTMIWIDMNTGAYMVLLTNRTYPDDKGKVSDVRLGVIETILQSQPEYAQYYADKKPE